MIDTSIFKEAAKNVTSYFWKNFLLQLSNGNFPPNLILEDQCLYVINSKGQRSSRLELSYCEDLAKDIIHFVIYRLKLPAEEPFDPEELELMSKASTKRLLNYSAVVKRRLFFDYADRTCEHFKEDKVIFLYCLIQLGILLRQINNKHLIMEKGRIVEIKGIVHTSSGFKLNLPGYKCFPSL